MTEFPLWVTNPLRINLDTHLKKSPYSQPPEESVFPSCGCDVGQVMGRYFPVSRV